MNLSEHFCWQEVERSPTAAQRGLDNRLPAAMRDNVQFTASYLERARQYLGGGPLRVTSWYRCPALNAAIGGSQTSKHMEGLAVDFQSLTMTLEAAFDYLAASRTIPFDQLIIEGTRDGARWIHLGFTRGTPRRDLFRASGAALGGPMTYERLAQG